MQIDGKLWFSNEAEKNGNEKLVSFSADLFQIGSLATVLSSNPFAWWMVPQHKRTEKLPRWWQPALNSCLGDEPEAPAQPLNTEWGRLTTGKKERNNKKKKISLTQGSLTEWIYGKLWLSITLKLMFSKSRIRPFEISSFHCISYSWGLALLYGIYYRVLMQAQLPLVSEGVTTHLLIKRRAGSPVAGLLSKKTSQNSRAKILEILKPFRQWL